MRWFATIILLVVAIAAQAMVPNAAHSHATNSHDSTLSPAVSVTVDAAPAAVVKHSVDTEQSVSHDRCATIGHCTASAIGADYFVYEAQRIRAARAAIRVHNEPERGFTFPPYRPPSPTL